LHLFDFLQSCVYVVGVGVGVGVAGGMALKNRALVAAAGGPARLNEPNGGPSGGRF